jgi:uncharacterized protein
MIWSEYNMDFITSSGNLLVYNFLYNNLAEVEKEKIIDVQNIKDNLKNHKTNSNVNNKILKFLVENSFVVDYEEEEAYKKMLQIRKKMQISDPTIRSYTIAPTLACNFNCSYCYEKERPSINMSDETENQIVKLINSDNRINNLLVTWYGGEPLMAFERIKSLTKKILLKKRFNYSAKMITNGFLFNNEIIKSLIKLKISDIQITVDGDKENHDKKRPLLNGGGTYERIIKNIKTIYSIYSNNEIKITIRVNIDNKNKDKYYDTFKELSRLFPEAVIYPGIIDATINDYCLKSDDCLSTQESITKFIIEEYKKHRGFFAIGAYPDFLLDKACIAESYYNYLIDPQGNLYKCWNDIGINDRIIGNINSKGKSNYIQLSKYLFDADPFNDEVCKQCKHLFLCGGGCVSRRIKDLNNKKKNSCHIFKDNIKALLELHYEAFHK